MEPTTPSAPPSAPTVRPIKSIAGKNYCFPFGLYRNRKVWEVMEGNPLDGFPADPKWLLANDGIKFNLSARIRDEVLTKVRGIQV